MNFLMESFLRVSHRYSYNHLQLAFFPIWIPCMSFAYHTPLAKTSSGILNKSGESRPHAGTWSLWGTFGYSPLSVAVTTGLSYISFIKLSMIPSSLNTPVTLLWSWRDVGFYQRPFLYLLRWSCGFYTQQRTVFIDLCVSSHPVSL